MDEHSAKTLSPSDPQWPPDDLPPQSCSSAMRQHVLGLVPYFVSLKPEELAEVNTVFHARPLVNGETLVNAGDPAERFLVIVSGRVKLTTTSASGAEHLVDVLGPGDSFGALPLLGATSNEASAMALTSGCVLEALPEEFASLVKRFPRGSAGGDRGG